MSVLLFILILIGLILVHELGHFSAAKFFGIRVDEFGIGFPPRLLKVRWGETDYTFNLLLVGGFVKIWGEDAQEGARDPRSLASKPRYVQALVIVAGIAMNIVFGWLALSAGYMVGLPTAADHQDFGTVMNVRPTVVSVVPDSPAQRAGLQAGDILERLETGSATLDLMALNTERQAQLATDFIIEHQDESIVLAVDRNGKDEAFVVRGVEGLVEGRKAVGIQTADIGMLQLPPHLALVEGAIAAKELTAATAAGLAAFFGDLLQGTPDLAQVSGPVGIANVGSQAVNSGFAAVITLTALISINLGIINLVPIPGLDGGRLLIIAIEGAIRRPLSPRLTTGLVVAGFVFLIGLTIFVTVSDIGKLIG